MRDAETPTFAGLLGTTLALACVPKVPATIATDSAAPVEPPRRANKQPKAPADGLDRTPPRVVRAELRSATRLRIHFSEPVVVGPSFDPNDFRLSYLRRYSDRSAPSYSAYYYDVAYFHYGDITELHDARPSDARLDLELTPAFVTDLCHERYAPEYGPGIDGSSGLFLHYAAGSIPIADASGNALASFGADWVVAREGDDPVRMVIEGARARSAGSGLVALPCGPVIPPGPR